MVEHLPVLRKINNLTQKGLGEVIGVTRQTITNIESGRSEMVNFFDINVYIFIR